MRCKVRWRWGGSETREAFNTVFILKMYKSYLATNLPETVVYDGRNKTKTRNTTTLTKQEPR